MLCACVHSDWDTRTYVRPDRFDPLENALERCNQRGDGSCRVYAIDGRVVWQSP